MAKPRSWAGRTRGVEDSAISTSEYGFSSPLGQVDSNFRFIALAITAAALCGSSCRCWFSVNVNRPTALAAR